METIRESFEQQPDAHWRLHAVGAGSVELSGSALLLGMTNAASSRYSNAQMDDYKGLPRARFPWRPPLRLTVRARFSAPASRLSGTAGFGFWNDPFLMTEARLPTLPRALWFFFASPPSNMKLDLPTPGFGWKAATIDAQNPKALAWIPAAPLAVPMMNLRTVYDALWPLIQKALNVGEALIDVDTTHWHTYSLEWDLEHSRFTVAGEDGSNPRLILESRASPRGPLGFVMWLDNQYLVATPWGKLRWGLLDVPGYQWLEVDHLAIEPLQDNLPE